MDANAQCAFARFADFVGSYCMSLLKHIDTVTAEFNAYCGIQMSERTIRRYIHKIKIRSYVLVQKPFLARKISSLVSNEQEIINSGQGCNGLMLHSLMNQALQYYRVRIEDVFARKESTI